MKKGNEEIILYPNSALMVEFLLGDRDPGDITKAILMLKYRLTDTDAQALVTKTIYLAANQHGVIATAQDCNDDERPLCQFTIAPEETENLSIGIKLFSALKLWTADGSGPYSPAKGRRGVRVEEPGVITTSSA